jgi:hypothetical protein
VIDLSADPASHRESLGRVWNVEPVLPRCNRTSYGPTAMVGVDQGQLGGSKLSWLVVTMLVHGPAGTSAYLGLTITTIEINLAIV